MHIASTNILHLLMSDIVLVTMGKRVVAELEPRGTRRTIVKNIFI